MRKKLATKETKLSSCLQIPVALLRALIQNARAQNAVTALLFGLLFLPGPSQPAAAQLTIAEAVEKALARYPEIHSAEEQLRAVSRNIRLAQLAYYPRVHFYGQWNRATRNNVLGLLLPQPYFSPISGPVLGETNDMGSAWGSLSGVLVSWNPIDFGYRSAQIELAETERASAQLRERLARLQVAAQTATAFLDVLAAEEIERSVLAALNRIRELEKITDALVSAGLRSEVDRQQVIAERVDTEVRYNRAQETLELAKITLSQFIAEPPAAVALQGTPFKKSLPPADTPQCTAQDHPLVGLATSLEHFHELKQTLAKKSLYPRLDFMATVYARGTGARPDGRLEGGFTGLGPNVSNWAVGLVATFTPTEWYRAKEQIQQQVHLARSYSAVREKHLRDLNAAIAQAQAQLNTARTVAGQIPEKVAAAQRAYELSRTRYQTGLTNIVEVLDAQRLLAQAEADAALANLAAWRALLQLAVASGDISVFLQLVKTQQ